MTLPTPSDRATGVKTDGEGKHTTAHLNLTVSLADVGKALHHRHRALNRAPREVIADHKIPYAGKPR